jgi:uncharacterized phage protein (TIGR01671 family)
MEENINTNKDYYRGKSIVDGSWLYGSLITRGERFFIMPFDWSIDLEDSQVEKKTIGMYTGSVDSFGKRIFSGSILASPYFQKLNGSWGYLYHIVEWSYKYCGWVVRSINNKEQLDSDGILKQGNLLLWVYISNYKEKMEVIGNIFDNSELVNVK